MGTTHAARFTSLQAGHTVMLSLVEQADRLVRSRTMTVEVWRDGKYVRTIRLNRSTAIAVIRAVNDSAEPLSGTHYVIVSNGLRN